MSERTALVSIATLAAMDVMKDLMHNPAFLTHAPPIDLEGIIYGSLIQCGAERFELRDLETIKRPKSEFLNSRIKIIPNDEIDEVRSQTWEVFTRFLPDDWWHNDKYSEVQQVRWFLDELLLAAERKTSLATHYPVPNVEKLGDLMPPELLIPVRNLLTTLEPNPTSLPLPKMQVSHEDVRRYKQVMESDLFTAYSARHFDLEDASIQGQIALDGVAEKGGEIVRRNVDLFALKKLTISLLPITAGVIDTVFGRVPGIVSDYLANALTDMMNQERRLVVYQLGSVYDEALQPYIKRIRLAIGTDQDE